MKNTVIECQIAEHFDSPELNTEQVIEVYTEQLIDDVYAEVGMNEDYLLGVSVLEDFFKTDEFTELFLELEIDPFASKSMKEAKAEFIKQQVTDMVMRNEREQVKFYNNNCR